MGLSKRQRVRNTVSENEELILRYTQAIQPALQQAIRTCVWLEGMHTQLKYTTLALRDRPAVALAHFQKTLGRPSYFLTSTNANHWVVLLGPRTSAPTPTVKAPKALPTPVAVASARASIGFSRAIFKATRFVVSSLRGLQQWLMHPVIDTGEPS